MSLRDVTDEVLMDRYCAGETQAFAEFFRRYSARIARFVVPYVGKTHSEDLAQQVFLRVHNSRGTFRAGARVAPWVFTIAKNMALDHLRSAATRRELADGDDHDVPVDAPEPDPRLSAAVRKAVLGLPPDQREVISLHWFGGLSMAEIGTVVGASHEAVRARAHRAYGQLRSVLGPLASELDLTSMGGAP